VRLRGIGGGALFDGDDDLAAQVADALLYAVEIIIAQIASELL